MSEQEKESGTIIPGTIGALAGGALAYKGAGIKVGNSGTLKALRGQETTPKFVEAVKKLAPLEPVEPAATAAAPEVPAAKTPTLGERRNELKKLKGFTTTEGNGSVNKITAIADAKGGTHTIQIHGEGDTILHEIKELKGTLPAGLEAGAEKAVTDAGKIKELLVGEESFLAKHVAKGEKSLASEIRVAGGKFFGFKNTSAGGKTGIIAATVAGVAVGAMALNAMFGGSGKYTSRVNEERSAEPAVGAAR